MARETHSQKALTTLAAMNTSPDAWQLTEIKWVEEEREVVGLVMCPTCFGAKKVCRDENGEPLPIPARDTRERVAYDNAARKQNRGRYDGCPTCVKRQRGYLVSQGKVKGLVTKLVMVGYPQWPEGTEFTSRFVGGHACHLCNKSVMKSLRVPVQGVDADGNNCGMWVGSDCAKKFLAVKIKRASDSVMED